MTATLALLVPLEAPTCPAHRTYLRPNGTCARCELEKSTAYRAMCDAMSRLDDGDYLPAEARQLRIIVAAFRWCQAMAEHDARTSPNGCAVCGAEKQGHGLRYGGGHRSFATGLVHVAPTNQERLDRMMARRAYAGGQPHAAVDRLFVRAIPTCGTCRKRPATLAAERRSCFSLSLGLDSRWDR